jgi:hypothetical protein
MTAFLTIVQFYKAEEQSSGILYITTDFALKFILYTCCCIIKKDIVPHFASSIVLNVTSFTSSQTNAGSCANTFPTLIQ